MAKYKATCNFIVESTDQNFTEGRVYDLPSVEADEINRKINASFGEQWLVLETNETEEALTTPAIE